MLAALRGERREGLQGLQGRGVRGGGGGRTVVKRRRNGCYGAVAGNKDRGAPGESGSGWRSREQERKGAKAGVVCTLLVVLLEGRPHWGEAVLVEDVAPSSNEPESNEHVPDACPLALEALLRPGSKAPKPRHSQPAAASSGVHGADQQRPDQGSTAIRKWLECLLCEAAEVPATSTYPAAVRAIASGSPVLEELVLFAHGRR